MFFFFADFAHSLEVLASGRTPAFGGVSLCAVASIALFFAPDWLWQALQRVGG